MGDAIQAVEQQLHLGAELEKLTKMVAEVESALMLPVESVKETAPRAPDELIGVLEGHVHTVMQLQSEMSRIISQVGLLHSALVCKAGAPGMGMNVR